MEPGALVRPFFQQQRPKCLLTGKLTCGECGASYANSGKDRFGCQGSSKKGDAYCSNRLTVRQDVLDRRVLADLSSELLRDEVLAVFLEEFEAETARLRSESEVLRPGRDHEVADIISQFANMTAAILKGVDATLFVDKMNMLGRRQAYLVSDKVSVTSAGLPHPLSPDLSSTYRAKVADLTAAFTDKALELEAFELLRSLIQSVVLTREDGLLSVALRGEFSLLLLLLLWSEPGQHNAPEAGAFRGVGDRFGCGDRI